MQQQECSNRTDLLLLALTDPIHHSDLPQPPSSTTMRLSTDQPLVPLARRRTGVKNGCGTARDVVSFLVRSRPRISLTPGTGLPRGRSVPLRARGLDSSARRPVPGRYHLAGWQSARERSVRDAWTR